MALSSFLKFENSLNNVFLDSEGHQRTTFTEKASKKSQRLSKHVGSFVGLRGGLGQINYGLFQELEPQISSEKRFWISNS